MLTAITTTCKTYPIAIWATVGAGAFMIKAMTTATLSNSMFAEQNEQRQKEIANLMPNRL